MPLYQPTVPIKAIETIHTPLGTNRIVRFTIQNINNPNLVINDIHANIAQNGVQLTLDAALTFILHAFGGPLLWVYRSDGDLREIIFGFDFHVLDAAGQDQKIGHGSLAQTATISGEITRISAYWEIDNDSSRWGPMGSERGKKVMLQEVADFMRNHLGLRIREGQTYSREKSYGGIQKRLVKNTLVKRAKEFTAWVNGN